MTVALICIPIVCSHCLFCFYVILCLFSPFIWGNLGLDKVVASQSPDSAYASNLDRGRDEDTIVVLEAEEIETVGNNKRDSNHPSVAAKLQEELKLSAKIISALEELAKEDSEKWYCPSFKEATKHPQSALDKKDWLLQEKDK
jgi:hypothetical protein